MKITVKMLKAKHACSDQVELFQSLFPKGVEPTKALCRKHAEKFNWDWAARKSFIHPGVEGIYEAKPWRGRRI